MAIDPNIKKKADDIRNKIYGKEVRESLASGLEEMSSDVVENEGRQSVVESRQDSVESQWQSVIDETTNLDVVSAPEIIAARDGEANLKARLDKEHGKVAAQSAHAIINKANAKKPLKINTYDGSGQPTHPKVLYFSNGWNGWRYWMAYTPFPYDVEALENPCIAVSNNGIDWVTPDGLENPLAEPTQSELNDGWYYSDTHLVFNNDSAQMECWYRFYKPQPATTRIKRRVSSDGVNWASEEVMTTTSMLSPAIIYENSKYKLWHTGSSKVTYRESVNGRDWTGTQTLNLNLPNNHTPWHIDVVKTNKGYEMLLNTNVSGRGLQRELVHGISTNGVDWGDFEVVLKPSKATDHFDSYAIYRSTFVLVDGVYHVYYSAHDQNQFWGIGLSMGDDLRKLVGYDTNKNHLLQSNSLVLSGTAENPVNIKLTDYGLYGANVNLVGQDTVAVMNDWNTELGNLEISRLFTGGISQTRDSLSVRSVDKPVKIKLTEYGMGGVTFEVTAPDELTLKTDAEGDRASLLLKELDTRNVVTQRVSLAGSSQNPTYIKMTDYGVAGAGIKIDADETDTLKIVTDGGTNNGSLKVSQVIFDTYNTKAIEGSLRYNRNTKKHEGYDGTTWHALY